MPFVFTVFKDLVSKMLNPSSTHRLKIQEVEKHQWILGVFVEEFPPVDERWKRETIMRFAENDNLVAKSVAQQLVQNPFGQLGGMYNIEKLQYQISKISYRKAPSCFKIHNIKVINQTMSINPSQISTSTLQNHPEASTINRPTTSKNQVHVATGAKPRQRPRTAQANTGTLKLLDSKLRG